MEQKKPRIRSQNMQNVSSNGTLSRKHENIET
jgi:hypothetical protein